MNAEYTTLPLNTRVTFDAIACPSGWLQDRVGFKIGLASRSGWLQDWVGFNKGTAWRVISRTTAKGCGILCCFGERLSRVRLPNFFQHARLRLTSCEHSKLLAGVNRFMPHSHACRFLRVAVFMLSHESILHEMSFLIMD